MMLSTYCWVKRPTARTSFIASARITQRLIAEKDFTAVAVEADWPDAYRVNHYVHNQSDDRTNEQALAGFKRFPTWMWRNTDVVAFVDWLRSLRYRTICRT
jgi:erythromycin esterase-like protein